MDWRATVKDKREIKLFEALENPKYLWRTKGALQEASGLTPEQIEAVTRMHALFIREGRTESGEPITGSSGALLEEIRVYTPDSRLHVQYRNIVWPGVTGVMHLMEVIGWGLFGGVLAELAGMVEVSRTSGDRPYWVRSPFYWIVVMVKVLAGGIVVLAYDRSGMSLNPIVAINVGASAPLAWKTISGALPRRTAPDPSSVN